MARSVPYRAGDLFAVPLPDGTFATARILLDVSEQGLKPGIIPRSSPLKPFEDALLVEVYRVVTPEPSSQVAAAAIAGVFVAPRQLSSGGKGKWPLTGHLDVDPTTVAFPEGLLHARGSGGRIAFLSGEIERDLELDDGQLERYSARPSVINPPAFVNACCYYLGRKELLGEVAEFMSLRTSDLRFTDDRDEIYRLMHEDPSRSYYDRAKAMGFDLSRFYR
jgi:hypothetical protein